MEAHGTVVQKLENRRILVEIVRQSACGGNCHSCGSCGGTTSRIVAECEDSVAVGESVVVQISDNRYFLISFLVFLLPLCVIVASFLGFRPFFTEDAASLGAFFSGVVSFVLIVLASRKLKMPKAHKDIITKE